MLLFPLSILYRRRVGERKMTVGGGTNRSRERVTESIACLLIESNREADRSALISEAAGNSFEDPRSLASDMERGGWRTRRTTSTQRITGRGNCVDGWNNVEVIDIEIVVKQWYRSIETAVLEKVRTYGRIRKRRKKQKKEEKRRKNERNRSCSMYVFAGPTRGSVRFVE